LFLALIRCEPLLKNAIVPVALASSDGLSQVIDRARIAKGGPRLEPLRLKCTPILVGAIALSI